MPKWRPYLEDVAFQFAVLSELFPKSDIVPYLCLTDKSKTTSIEQIFSKFELVRPRNSDKQFVRPLVSYVGDQSELQKNSFLTILNVAAEVKELLPDVQKSSLTFAQSIQNGVTKIPIQINVDCRKCEYRFVPGGNAKRSDWDKEGFHECWGGLADEEPNLLDYYYVSSIGRSQALINALIGRKRVRLGDVEEADLVKADGTPGPINFRQRIQREYTLANREYFGAGLKAASRKTDLPSPLY